MDIVIMSREDIERMSLRPFAGRTALISIADHGDGFAELAHEPDYLLRLEFDDVDGDVFADELGRAPAEHERLMIEKKYHMLTDEQAKRIADFYGAHRGEADVLICQCEYGQSRSAAVAAAVMEHRCGNGITVFADDAYFPNKLVFRKVLKCLAEQSCEDV